MYKYAVFDLDGTLANTLEDLADAVNYSLEKNGYKKHHVDAYKQMVGSGIVNLIRAASGINVDIDVAMLKKDFDYYYGIHTMDKTSEYEGGQQMLVDLQKAGVTLAVLSNKPDTFVKSILDRLFPDVTFAIAWGKKEGFEIKPNPQSLNAMLSSLGADKSDVVYVGDSNVDVLTAKNGGIDFIGCAWGFRGEEELLQAGASKIAYSCEQLAKLILGE